MLQRLLAVAAIVSTLLFACVARSATPADCGGADIVVAGKLRTLFQRDDARSRSLASRSLPKLERARELCAGPQADAALRLYGQLLLYMEMQLTVVPDIATAAAERKADPPAALTPPR